MRLIYLLIIPLVLFGCRQSTPLREEVREGLNGKATYRYKDSKVVFVYKEELARAGRFISINRDTLKLNDELILTVLFPAKLNPKLILTSPEEKIIENWKESVDYTYQVQKRGILEVTGELQSDSVVVPFSYSIIVL
jgi:hypothetical protein